MLVFLPLRCVVRTLFVFALPSSLIFRTRSLSCCPGGQGEQGMTGCDDAHRHKEDQEHSQGAQDTQVAQQQKTADGPDPAPTGASLSHAKSWIKVQCCISDQKPPAVGVLGVKRASWCSLRGFPHCLVHISASCTSTIECRCSGSVKSAI